MKLSSISAPNFKGVYAIQVPKKYFPDQNNTYQVNAYFKNDLENELISRFDIKKQSFFQKIANFFKGEKQPKMPECFEVLESPGYMEIKDVLEDGPWGEVSLDWVDMNAKTNLTRPADKDYNTFYILTGEEAKKAENAFSRTNKFFEKQLASNTVEYSEDPFIDEMRETAKLSEVLDKTFKEITKGKLVGIYKIDEFAKDFREAVHDINFEA